ncbi:MAG: family 10 glycosylhydrolase [Firmicutes bacterium]|jgi:uncharacterized lipoprotein YddW (UPF0748 family)|nr:family 10 glycosylhydrolase [Bacillota bacterium]
MPKRFFRSFAIVTVALLLATLASGCKLPLISARQGRPALPPPSGHQEQGIRAVWLWGSTVRTEGAEAVAQKLQDNYINAAFLLVRGTAGTAGYASQIAPQADPSQDALANLIAACKPRGIQVHAWFVFNEDKAFTDAHPAERLWHHGNANSGYQPYAITDGRVCPNSEAHLQYTEDMIREVLQNYDVDGIHLDYIRYGHVVYCFCPTHQAKAASLGIDLSRVRQAVFDTFYANPANANAIFDAYAAGDPDVAAWMDMRMEEIRYAATRMRNLTKQIKPNAVFSASLMPEGADPATKVWAHCHYAQSYADAADLYDFISPMAYHVSYGKPASWVRTLTQNAVADVSGKCKVYTGIQAHEAATPSSVADAIFAAADGGAKGFALFRYGTIDDNEWAAVRGALAEIGPWAPVSDFVIGGPNPTSSSVTFHYNIPVSSTLEIYSSLGACVFSTPVTSGEGTLAWNLVDSSGARVAPGTYTYVMSVPGYGKSWPRKIVVTK